MLKPGDIAPDFSGRDETGRAISLADFKKKKLALYFYPKDMTSGCTAEACNLRDNYDILKSKGIAIVGVSADDAASHAKFRQKHELPFPLIADTDKKLIDAYGVWGAKSFMGRRFMGIHRTTFLIENGKIKSIIDKVKVDGHANQIVEGFR